MAQPQPALPSVHQLKVTLRDVRPAVWRRLQVPSATTLGELSDILLEVFGWYGDHLHEFEARGAHYGPPELQNPQGLAAFFAPEVHDEDAAVLGRVTPRPGAVLDYTYDFGDDWRHRIEVEDVFPADPDESYPCCTGGRGLAPEEDTGEIRPGRFDQMDVSILNDALRKQHGATAGRELAAAAGSRPEPDPVFADRFPDLAEEATGPAAAGRSTARTRPRCYAPTSRSPTPTWRSWQRRPSWCAGALALARWVGKDRVLTPSRLLRPGEAQLAVAELGLAEPVLPPATDPLPDAGFGSWVSRRKEREAARAAASGKKRKLRSARELPALHDLWSAAVDAGLIDIRGTAASTGESARLWEDGGSPQQRLNSWARLLAGYLRSRVESARAARRYQPIRPEELLPASAQVLYELARNPVPAALPALVLTTSGAGGVVGGFGPNGHLLAAVEAASQDWALAGVIAAVDPASAGAQPMDDGAVQEAVGSLLAAVLAGFGTDGDEDLQQDEDEDGGGDAAGVLTVEAFAQAVLGPVVDAVRATPAVRLTPLGAYGIQRMFTAHGWRARVFGDCADVVPADLLDRLCQFLAEDALVEAELWLAARGEQWDPALREVAESARSEDRGRGPARRAAFQLVLHAAGQRAAPLLDSYAADPWLAAVVAGAKHVLGLGPEPTLAHQLWLAIDELSQHPDDPAHDRAETAAISDLPELLTQDGAIATAVALDHPYANEALRLAREPVQAMAGGRAIKDTSRPVLGDGSTPTSRSITDRQVR